MLVTAPKNAAFRVYVNAAGTKGKLLGTAKKVARNRYPNLFFDTSSYGRRALEVCVETFGVEQLVHGSDAPVIDPLPTLRAIRGFGESVERLVTWDNPNRLLT